MSDLATRHCNPCHAGDAPLTKAAAQALLNHLNNWQINDTSTEINRIFNFKNYYQTIAFVNAVAWIAHQEDHHPALTVHYNHCEVRYSTHAINGLSENDFICAAKTDVLV